MTTQSMSDALRRQNWRVNFGNGSSCVSPTARELGSKASRPAEASVGLYASAGLGAPVASIGVASHSGRAAPPAGM